MIFLGSFLDYFLLFSQILMAIILNVTMGVFIQVLYFLLFGSFIDAFGLFFRFIQTIGLNLHFRSI
jgi:hypothetical protein